MKVKRGTRRVECLFTSERGRLVKDPCKSHSKVAWELGLAYR